MRGSIVGLSLDSSLSDLALKFNITLESIALQTRHILDEMKDHGHVIEGIYISGGQAKNKPLVQLLADVCKVPIILPNNHSAAVVLGAAMLGKFAQEVTNDMATRGEESGLQSQGDVDKESERVGERLWEIMVCAIAGYWDQPLTMTGKVEMTQPGEIVYSASSHADTVPDQSLSKHQSLIRLAFPSAELFYSQIKYSLIHVYYISTFSFNMRGIASLHRLMPQLKVPAIRALVYKD